jgi:hypothetical protein
MGHCGNASLLRINVNVLLRQEGKFGMGNKYFRMKYFYVLLRSNKTEQRICIKPHMQISFSHESLGRAPNFSIYRNNNKGEDKLKNLISLMLFIKKYCKW